jgi:hypothetical protein
VIGITLEDLPPILIHRHLMKLRQVPKSPEFPTDKKWEIKKRKDGYESEVTALVRSLLEDQTIRADQRWAWERWRNDESKLKKP